ncbi:hypothetical protein STEG23_014461 [Scotinomys teguina]
MQEIEKLSKPSGNIDASITNRIQEMEDRISNVEDTIEKIDSSVKENTKSKKVIKQNVQEIWDTMKRPNIRIIGIEEGEEYQLKGMENIFNKIIEENFPNLKNEPPIKIQEAYRTPNRLDPQKKSSHHIIIKTLNIQNKERILRAAKEKGQLTYKGRPIRITPDFSMETLKARRYEHLIFDKDAKTVKWKKESIFNKWCWHNWMSTCRRLQIDPYLSPYTKLKSKWINDLNIYPITLNLIEEKVESTLERIGTGDHLLNITPIAQTLSATVDQWDYMKLRSFCKAKDTVTKTKRQPTEWEKIFTNPISDRGLISRIYKELKKHDIKTSNSPIEK